MVTGKDGLFSPDTVYAPPAAPREELLAAVAEDLEEKALVKPGFLKNLLQRERDYPTGLDLTVVDPALPNIAIPHTECEFVNVTRIVPVRLAEPVEWHDMLDPSRTLDVSFLFMILNADMEAQTGLLAAIMDFVNGLGAPGLEELLALEDPAAIHRFLCERFPVAVEA